MGVKIFNLKKRKFSIHGNIRFMYVSILLFNLYILLKFILPEDGPYEAETRPTSIYVRSINLYEILKFKFLIFIPNFNYSVIILLFHALIKFLITSIYFLYFFLIALNIFYYTFLFKMKLNDRHHCINVHSIFNINV